jgi:hypothetical protein
LKISEKNQFLHEATTQQDCTDIIKEVVLINNLRVKIDLLAMYIENLMKHGPLKPEDSRGLKETENLDADIEDKYKVPKIKMPKPMGTKLNEDPTAQRSGWILEDDITNLILKACFDAKDLISTKKVEDKYVTKIKDLTDQLDFLRGAMMIGYPGYAGLPEWEPARQVLEENCDLLKKEVPNLDFINFDTAALWYAGKELERGKKLFEYIGKNEKTKLVCKVTKKGNGGPVREPLIDKDTHKKMLSFYFKKQEEQKKLEEENDDSYMNSKWADGKGLKNSLYGNSDVTWKFK